MYGWPQTEISQRKSFEDDVRFLQLRACTLQWDEILSEETFRFFDHFLKLSYSNSMILWKIDDISFCKTYELENLSGK